MRCEGKRVRMTFHLQTGRIEASLPEMKKTSGAVTWGRKSGQKFSRGMLSLKCLLDVQVDLSKQQLDV